MRITSVNKSRKIMTTVQIFVLKVSYRYTNKRLIMLILSKFKHFVNVKICIIKEMNNFLV